MYSYVYDAFLAEGRFARELAQIETRLTDLGMTGRIDRLGPLRHPRELLRDAVRKGARTIVVVGNDDTIRQVVEVFPDFSVALGIIPLGTPNRIAQFLGIPVGVAACDVLSARIIESVDLGKINKKYFLAAVTIPKGNLTISCEDLFRVTPVRGGTVSVCNLMDPEQMQICNPQDGVFDLYVRPPRNIKTFFRPTRRGEQTSVLPLRRVVVSSASPEPCTVFIDGDRVEETSFTIEIAGEKLRMVTGRGRKFVAHRRQTTPRPKN